MEATSTGQIPFGEQWQFEPKWDGFRCLAFRQDDTVVLQSKSGQPLTKYFPELVRSFQGLREKAFVLDGEIIVPLDQNLSFDDLLLRIHPAVSRIMRLAEETPARFVAFDLLYDRKHGVVTKWSLSRRRKALKQFFSGIPAKELIRLSPATTDRATAEDWFHNCGSMGLDGIVAKLHEEPYRSGERTGMIKVKRLKTADCVVGGCRYMADGRIASLLLGLYDDGRQLMFVGHTSSFTDGERAELRKIVERYKGASAFRGRVPGGPSRWSTKKSTEWQALRPVLVCEVRYDYFSQNRFRHGTKFLRWRPDKDPKSCTLDQVAFRTRRGGMPGMLQAILQP
jgi:ATP-dependent DNA ligase